MQLDLLSTRDVAAALGVSERRVRALVSQGDLAAARVGPSLLVEPESLARYQSVGRARTRALSPRMSWAALLSDLATRDVDRVNTAFGLSYTEQGRLRKRRSRDASDWSWLARRRDRVDRVTVRNAYLPDVLAYHGAIASGMSALDHYDVDLTTRADSAEIYTSAETAEALTQEFSLRADAVGNLVMHVLPEIDAVHELLDDRSTMTAATVAVDLLETGESRAGRAGLDLLQRVLDRAD